MPSGADVAAWLETHGALNIGLRMPPGVIGLDVDDYGSKTGAATLAALVERFGPLPPTWVSSARPAPSGIRFYRVPTHIDGREINWPGEAGKFIEIIQTGHRYAVAWPSTNPEAGGAEYRWRHEPTGGTVLADGQVIAPEMLPELPEAWVRGLMLAYDRAEKGELPTPALAQWWRELRDGEPCPVVAKVTGKAVDDLKDTNGARHESTRDALAALVRLGGEGHRGTPEAVVHLGQAFADAVGPERIAAGELRRLIAGAVQLAAATHAHPVQHCEHDDATSIDVDMLAFVELAEKQRRAEQDAAAAATRTRVEQLAAEVEQLPFDQRAETVRRLIPEIATWAPAEQDYARDHLTKKSGLSDLGVTDFRRLVTAEERARKEAAEAAVQQARQQRHTEQVAVAASEGRLLPPPHDPVKVARALAPRLERPARWWRGDYYLWTGARYVEWRAEAVDNWLYRQTEHAEYEQSEDKGPAPWRPTETKIGSLSHALSRGVLYRDSAAEPDDSASHVVCENGVYDVTNNVLMPHDPGRFNLQAVPFAYDPNATCPTWEWYLADVLPADAIRLLRQWFGYAVSGRTDQEKILHMQGLPRSGKGTAANMLENLLGQENVASPSMPSLVSTFGEQPLIGKTLAVLSDINWQFRDIAEAVEIVKKISGRDSRDVQRKNREVWHGKLGVRFMIMGNDLPSFKDASGALAYRLLHIRFPGTVQGREDPTLKDRLLSELPGVLNWAIEGLRDLDAMGSFVEPESARELAAEVRRQQGPAQAFLEDTCARAEGAPAVPLSELHPVYVAWARRAGVEHVLDRERFSRALASAGLAVERKMINGVRERRVNGLVPLVHEGTSEWVRLLNPYGTVPPTT